MLSFDRRTLIVSLLALPAAGCGFTPVYKAGSAARTLEGNIRFTLIDSREGFLLLQRLEQRFGRPRTEAPYHATLDLSFSEKELTLIATTGLARHTLSGKLTVALRRQGVDGVLFSDSLRNTAGYTSSVETLVSEAAKQDAYRRLTLSLADRLATRLSASAESWTR